MVMWDVLINMYTIIVHTLLAIVDSSSTGSG